MDIHIPEVGGFAMLEKLAELHYEMPVIFMSGKAEVEDCEMAMGKGALGFLQKPFSIDSLIKLLDSGA